MFNPKTHDQNIDKNFSLVSAFALKGNYRLELFEITLIEWMRAKQKDERLERIKNAYFVHVNF